MLSVSLGEHLENEPKMLADRMEKTLVECLKDAVKDYMVGVAAMKQNEPSMTLDELESKFWLGRLKSRKPQFDKCPGWIHRFVIGSCVFF